MLETLVGAVIGLVGLVGGMLIKHWLERTKHRQDIQRWYLDRLLGHKIETLHSLLSALVETHDSLNASIGIATLKDYNEKVQAPLNRFETAMVVSRIYLKDDMYSLLRESLGAFRQASMAVFLNLPQEEIPNVHLNSYSRETKSIDHPRLHDSFDKSLKELARILNPSSLKKLEELTT